MAKALLLLTELTPFFERSSLAAISHELLASVRNSGHEVRVIMPRYSVINERVHRVHQVQRLCGINVRVGKENISLIVKVASLKKLHSQVYFIDNEDLFVSKRNLLQSDGQLCPNGDTQIAFIGKAVLSILEHLAWFPDIVHCVGWPWAFVPMYSRGGYKNTILAAETKFLYTFGAEIFKDQLGEEMYNKAQLYNLGVGQDPLKLLGPQVDFEGFVNLATTYSDKVTYSFTEKEAPVLPLLQRHGVLPIVPDEEMTSHYQALYQELLAKEDAEASVPNKKFSTYQ